MSPHFASGAVVVAVVVFMAAAGVGAGGTGFIGQVLPDVPLETGLFGASIEINGDVVVVGAPCRFFFLFVFCFLFCLFCVVVPRGWRWGLLSCQRPPLTPPFGTIPTPGLCRSCRR